MHCRMFSSMPVLDLLDATVPTPSCDNVCRQCQKSPGVENHCYIQFQSQESDVVLIPLTGLHTPHSTSVYVCLCAGTCVHVLLQSSAVATHTGVWNPHLHQDPELRDPFLRPSGTQCHTASQVLTVNITSPQNSRTCRKPRGQ